MRTRIKSLREDSDLTQKDLSKYLNITQVAYSYYELNKRSIPLDLLSKLADFITLVLIIYYTVPIFHILILKINRKEQKNLFKYSITVFLLSLFHKKGP